MSPKRIARALGAVGAVALCVIVVVTVRVVRHRSARQAFENAAGLMPNSLLHAHNFHWTQMKGSQNQWVLKAKDASYAADSSDSSAQASQVKCVGGNACKGQSLCQSAESSCKGSNACKGKGYVMTPTAKECIAAGGKPDTSKKTD